MRTRAESSCRTSASSTAHVIHSPVKHHPVPRRDIGSTTYSSVCVETSNCNWWRREFLLARHNRCHSPFWEIITESTTTALTITSNENKTLRQTDKRRSIDVELTVSYPSRMNVCLLVYHSNRAQALVAWGCLPRHQLIQATSQKEHLQSIKRTVTQSEGKISRRSYVWRKRNLTSDIRRPAGKIT